MASGENSSVKRRKKNKCRHLVGVMRRPSVIGSSRASFLVHHTSSPTHGHALASGSRPPPREGKVLQRYAAERGVAVQVFDQVLDAIQVATKQGLLLALRANAPAHAGGPRSPAARVATTAAGEGVGLGQFGRAPLRRQGRRRVAACGAGRRRGLGHQVEVQELHALELDVAAGAPGPEERGHGEQAVQVLERARVLGRVDERGHESEESGCLNGRAEVGLKEVQKNLNGGERGAKERGGARGDQE